MSDSISRSNTGREKESPTVPRAHIHKRILDAAEADPSASMESLAADISGASVELVQRVFNEYGDPGSHDSPEEDETDIATSNEQAPDQSSDDSAMSTESESEDTTELTDKQRETLRAIYENPGATQEALAEQLDVSRATINRRVNEIEGFDWTSRTQFVNEMFENGTQPDSGTPTSTGTPDELTDRIDDLAAQVEALVTQIDGESPSGETPFTDPDLAYKVVKACLSHEQITEDEEERIVKTMLTTRM